MNRRLAYLGSGAAVALAMLLAGGGVAASTSPPRPGRLAPIHGTYAPTIDPANFGRRIDNPYLPFRPGTRIHFEGVRGRTPLFFQRFVNVTVTVRVTSFVTVASRSGSDLMS